MNSNDLTNDIAAEWEKKAIMNTATLWKANHNTAFIRSFLPDVDIPNRELALDMNYMVGRSIPDELQGESE